MVIRILLTLFILLCALYLGYLIGYTIAQEEVENQRSDEPEQDEVTFTYCMRKDIKEAFKVSEGVLPSWALENNIDVQISPEMKIVVHKPNGYNVVARNTDYLVRDESGDMYSCPENIFENAYEKIEM